VVTGPLDGALAGGVIALVVAIAAGGSSGTATFGGRGSGAVMVAIAAPGVATRGARDLQATATAIAIATAQSAASFIRSVRGGSDAATVMGVGSARRGGAPGVLAGNRLSRSSSACSGATW
jgi:hypothetical protein